MRDLVLFIPHLYLTLGNIAGLLTLISFFYYIWVLITRSRIISTKHNNFNHTESSSVCSPPEVTGRWPIVGHLPQLVGSTPLFRILGDMSEKYGPIFMVRFGMHPTLVVSNWEMSKECFATNDKFLASRPSSAAGKHLTFAMFAFSIYGPYWREIRKITTHELLSPRRLELLNHVRYLEIDNYVKTLYQRSTSSAPGSLKTDMSQMFGELTLTVALKMVVGKPLIIKHDDTDKEEDRNKEEEQEGQKLYKTIIEFFLLAGVSVASDILPFLGWLDIDGQKRNMKRVAKEMDFFAKKWLEEHRQKNKLKKIQGSNKDDAGDFMDMLISALDEEEEQDDLFFGYNRDTVIKATCLTLIIAARDTTSASLTWALSLLLTNPIVLRKAQNELDTVVGNERKVEERDIIQLVYLQAIVKETLRLYPPAPLSVPHEAINDCNIGGYKVRAGTRVLVNLWKLHRDPRVWCDPLEFKPERFLSQKNGVGGESANIDFRGQHFEFTPFGSGRRMCPGVNFALQTLHMTLARLIHGFDFDDVSDGILIDMTEGPGLTMPRANPLEVKLRPRLPVTLY